MMDQIFWGGEEGERERQTSRSSTRSDSEEGGVARVLLIDCPCVFVNWIGGGGDAWGRRSLPEKWKEGGRV